MFSLFLFSLLLTILASSVNSLNFTFTFEDGLYTSSGNCVGYAHFSLIIDYYNLNATGIYKSQHALGGSPICNPNLYSSCASYSYNISVGKVSENEDQIQISIGTNDFCSSNCNISLALDSTYSCEQGCGWHSNGLFLQSRHTIYLCSISESNSNKILPLDKLRMKTCSNKKISPALNLMENSFKEKSILN